MSTTETVPTIGHIGHTRPPSGETDLRKHVVDTVFDAVKRLDFSNVYERGSYVAVVGYDEAFRIRVDMSRSPNSIQIYRSAHHTERYTRSISISIDRDTERLGEPAVYRIEQFLKKGALLRARDNAIANMRKDPHMAPAWAYLVDNVTHHLMSYFGITPGDVLAPSREYLPFPGTDILRTVPRVSRPGAGYTCAGSRFRLNASMDDIKLITNSFKVLGDHPAVLSDADAGGHMRIRLPVGSPIEKDAVLSDVWNHPAILGGFPIYISSVEQKEDCRILTLYSNPVPLAPVPAAADMSWIGYF